MANINNVIYGAKEISPSEVRYGYLHLGKKTGVAAKCSEPITVSCDGELLMRHVHSEQENRVDGLTTLMGKIHPGTLLGWIWYPEHKVLELIKP